MSYWDTFTNIFTRAVATQVVPTVTPVVPYRTLATTPLFTYKMPQYTYPTYSTPITYGTPSSFNFKNFFGNIGSSIKSGFQKVVRWCSNVGANIISAAKKYLGYNEKDGSYKLFTGGKNHAWCADFSSHVVKEAFRMAGKTVPSGFGSSSVSGLMAWANKNNCFLKTAGLSNKAGVIKNNVKAGDLIIFKEGGRSHVGIVEKIDANGTIHTIEGNTSNKVARRTYSPNNRTITGFAQIA